MAAQGIGLPCSASYSPPDSRTGSVGHSKAPEPRYAPNYTGNIKTANDRARAKKEPVAGKRKCNRCGELKDVDQFQIMNPRTRKRRPECKACNAIWRKDITPNIAVHAVLNLTQALAP